jgi:hypothetical protein
MCELQRQRRGIRRQALQTPHMKSYTSLRPNLAAISIVFMPNCSLHLRLVNSSSEKFFFFPWRCGARFRCKNAVWRCTNFGCL